MKFCHEEIGQATRGMMKRRTLIQSAIATGTVATLSPSAWANETELNIIDTNVSLSRWPFRRLPLDDTQQLAAKLRKLGITTALAGSFEGILQRDISSVNDRLVSECAGFSELIPVGSINPNLHGWEDDLKQCIGDHAMRGIRLHPNYHGYELNNPRFLKLLNLAADAKLFVQIAAVFEDVRTQPDQLRVADVDLTPLIENHVGRIQILNWRPRGELVEKLASIPNIHFDVSRMDQTDGVAAMLKTIPESRVMFGTHAPFLIPEASLIRVHESDLPDSSLSLLMNKNAKTFLTG